MLLEQEHQRLLQVNPVGVEIWTMTPLGFEGSDGAQNLTESLLAVQLVHAGVYVVMRNCVYPVHRARKDNTLGRFVWTDEQVIVHRLGVQFADLFAQRRFRNIPDGVPSN